VWPENGTLVVMPSFFFYDLETTGINPREARIMQFAGQRTDMDLNPIGKPYNILIRLSEDVVPDPDAIMITGITPQQTLLDGITEAEFLKLFHDEISVPETIFAGYNTVRFDDEFIRYLNYRNFYDAYEWSYANGRSRWDLLDVVRVTRALRPQGIEWPFDEKGNPVNKLELLTKLNGIEHLAAHDALSDVSAVISIAKLIRDKQPKLFEYLLKIRDKKSVARLVTAGQPFVYTSGQYDSAWQKTTVVGMLSDHPKRQGALVFDLRYDPTKFVDLSPQELAEAMRRRKDDPGPRLPVKLLQYNKCPAVAPISVLDDDSKERLKLDMKTTEANYEKLLKSNLAPAVLEAMEILEKRQEAKYAGVESEVDTQLYEGFFSDKDRTQMGIVRAAAPGELATLDIVFKDDRLNGLLPLYKARNYPGTLSDEERQAWERYRERKLLGGKQSSRLAKYFARLGELAGQSDLTSEQQYLLEELQLFGQSIMPTDIDQ
jgi:exodeoxyribonuclease-1